MEPTGGDKAQGIGSTLLLCSSGCKLRIPLCNSCFVPLQKQLPCCKSALAQTAALPLQLHGRFCLCKGKRSQLLLGVPTSVQHARGFPPPLLCFQQPRVSILLCSFRALLPLRKRKADAWLGLA